jgi:serine/threonine protein phosphatase 1
MVVAMDKSLLPDSPFYPYRLSHYKEIYIGHSPTIHLGANFGKPTNFANVWNVDTGAAFTGKLSAIDIDTKGIFQSDTVQSLYPNEKGRN